MLRSYGVKAYFGDAMRPDLLHAAGIDEARMLVIAIDERDSATELVRYITANITRTSISWSARWTGIMSTNCGVPGPATSFARRSTVHCGPAARRSRRSACTRTMPSDRSADSSSTTASRWRTWPRCTTRKFRHTRTPSTSRKPKSILPATSRPCGATVRRSAAVSIAAGCHRRSTTSTPRSMRRSSDSRDGTVNAAQAGSASVGLEKPDKRKRQPAPGGRLALFLGCYGQDTVRGIRRPACDAGSWPRGRGPSAAACPAR